MWLRKIQDRRLSRQLSVATWNTRGLGAESGDIDQELKIATVLERMRFKKWDIMGLTDLKYRQDGVKRFRHGGHDWYRWTGRIHAHGGLSLLVASRRRHSLDRRAGAAGCIYAVCTRPRAQPVRRSDKR